MNLPEKIIKEFENFHKVQIVILFGSALNQRLTRKSDIDIAFAQNSRAAHDEKTQIHIALERRLKRDIDLIDLHTVNGHILKTVLCEGDILIKKSIPLFAFFLKKMWYNQADMMPYTRMILENQVDSFING